MAKPRPLILFTDQIHALMTADVKKKSFANASRELITTPSGSCQGRRGHSQRVSHLPMYEEYTSPIGL